MLQYFGKPWEAALGGTHMVASMCLVFILALSLLNGCAAKSPDRANFHTSCAEWAQLKNEWEAEPKVYAQLLAGKGNQQDANAESVLEKASRLLTSSYPSDDRWRFIYPTTPLPPHDEHLRQEARKVVAVWLEDNAAALRELHALWDKKYYARSDVDLLEIESWLVSDMRANGLSNLILLRSAASRLDGDLETSGYYLVLYTKLYSLLASERNTSLDSAALFVGLRSFCRIVDAIIADGHTTKTLESVLEALNKSKSPLQIHSGTLEIKISYLMDCLSFMVKTDSATEMECIVFREIILNIQRRHSFHYISGYNIKKEEWERFESVFDDLSMLTTPSAYIFLSMQRKHAVSCNEEFDLARMKIALELFRRKHGQYPQTLAELTPEYLPALPHDPYDGKPYGYHLDDEAHSYTLASSFLAGQIPK